MKKNKLNVKNKHVQKRIAENPEIQKKDFEELLKRAVQSSKPERSQPE